MQKVGPRCSTTSCCSANENLLATVRAADLDDSALPFGGGAFGVGDGRRRCARAGAARLAQAAGRPKPDRQKHRDPVVGASGAGAVLSGKRRGGIRGKRSKSVDCQQSHYRFAPPGVCAPDGAALGRTHGAVAGAHALALVVRHPPGWRGAVLRVDCGGARYPDHHRPDRLPALYGVGTDAVDICDCPHRRLADHHRQQKTARRQPGHAGKRRCHDWRH